MRKKKYFLIGMPASGKSTIGKRIASRLGLEFIDLDKVIVAKEGKEITKIFEEDGENYFRELERKYLLDLIGHVEGFVLATGGGAPCFFDNIEQMNRSGVTIFLDVPVEELVNKLSKKGIEKRPLLKNIPRSDLFTELEKKLNDRKKYYARSQISLKQETKNLSERINDVIFAIQTLEK